MRIVFRYLSNRLVQVWQQACAVWQCSRRKLDNHTIYVTGHEDVKRAFIKPVKYQNVHSKYHRLCFRPPSEDCARILAVTDPNWPVHGHFMHQAADATRGKSVFACEMRIQVKHNIMNVTYTLNLPSSLGAHFLEGCRLPRSLVGCS